jgi:hypothetical protein
MTATTKRPPETDSQRAERLTAENARLREQLTALQAAYEALARENRCQSADLDSWHFLSEAMFAERAEGR